MHLTVLPNWFRLSWWKTVAQSLLRRPTTATWPRVVYGYSPSWDCRWMNPNLIKKMQDAEHRQKSCYRIVCNNGVAALKEKYVVWIKDLITLGKNNLFLNEARNLSPKFSHWNDTRQSVWCGKMHKIYLVESEPKPDLFWVDTWNDIYLSINRHSYRDGN